MSFISNFLNFIVVIIFFIALIFSNYVNKEKNDDSLTTFFKSEIEYIVSEIISSDLKINTLYDYFLNGNIHVYSNDISTYQKNLKISSLELIFDYKKRKINNIYASGIELILTKDFFHEFEGNNSNDFYSFINEIQINDSNISFPSFYDDTIRTLYFSSINIKLIDTNAFIIQLENEHIKSIFDINKDHISIELIGEYNYIYNFIKHSNFNYFIEDISKDWEVSGDIALTSKINLNTHEHTTEIKLNNNDIIFKDIKNLNLKNAIGSININNTSDDILIGEINHSLFGENIITSLKLNNDILSIDSSGSIQPNKLNEWINEPILNKLTGKTKFSSKLLLSKENNTLTVSSNLEGIEVDLISSLNKKKEDSSFFIFSQNFNDDKVNVTYNNNIFSFSKDGFNINLNGNTNKSNKKYSIFGEIKKITKNEINDLIFLYDKIGNFDTNEFLFNFDSNLHIKEFIFENKHFFNINIFTNSISEKDLVFNIEHENINGKVLISKDGSYIGEFKNLTLNFDKNSENLFTDVDLDFLKNGKIKAKNLYINDTNFYDLNIDIPKNTDSLIINITSNSNDYFIGGKFTHSKTDGITKFESINDKFIYGNDIYSLNKWSNEKSPLKTNKFYIDTELYWTGTPLDFNKESLRGRIDFNFDELTLKGVADDYSKMKVLNIFNFDNVFRFLMFDFKNISNKELNFKNFNLITRISEGVLNIDKLNFYGNDALINGEGQINLLTEEIDAKLKIQLPVTNKMPVLSLLAGASPQTAGIVFLAEKIFGDKIDEAFDIEIYLEGDISDITVIKK